MSLVAVARFEGVAEPRALGRLISLGRTDAGGVRFEWRPASPLVLEGVPQGLLRAELFKAPNLSV